jgi:hypothetical protein
MPHRPVEHRIAAILPAFPEEIVNFWSPRYRLGSSAMDDFQTDTDPLDPPEDTRGTRDERGEHRHEGIRGRLGHRGEEALADVAQILVDNPLLNQALQAAFGARDLATSATSSAIKGVGVGTASDVDRLTRRVRSISDRLEELEDKLDDLGDEISQLRNQTKSQGQVENEVSVPVDQVRLGLSE